MFSKIENKRYIDPDEFKLLGAYSADLKRVSFFMQSFQKELSSLVQRVDPEPTVPPPWQHLMISFGSRC